MSTSRLFEPLKSIGHITERLPLSFYFDPNDLSNKSLIFSSIGNTFHCYRFASLNLHHVGPRLSESITCMAVKNPNEIFIACGTDILIVEQRIVVGQLEGHAKRINYLLLIGEYLISIDRDHKCITWNTTTHEKLYEHKLSFVQDDDITCLLHPRTYLDKIIIGTRRGYIHLVNIRAGKQLYRFGPFKKETTSFFNETTSSSSSVTFLEDSPALDIVAIGLADGRILLLNLKYDKILMTFIHSPGPITAISFRTDVPNYMATGNGKGDIAIWDLEEKQLIKTLPETHDGITTLQFVPNENILITAGQDNCIKKFEIERPDLLIERVKIEGHSKPPQKVAFYDPLGNYLLTSSLDKQIRVTDINGENRTMTLSQQVSKKAEKLGVKSQDLYLPPVLDFDFCYLRQHDWNNLVTCHAFNTHEAFLWNVKKSVISKTPLSRSKKYGPVKCVAMSICGNYAILGRSAGYIEKWAVQSHRFVYEYPLIRQVQPDGNTKIKSTPAHDGAVTGVIVDNFNSKVVSGGFDGKLKFWDFTKHSLLEEINLFSPITKMRKSKNSNLLAIACDDLSIHVYDMTTCKLMRKFTGHVNKVNDMEFSHDGRILVTCGMDGYIFVHDILSSTMVDWIHVPLPATSLSMHPTGLFLTTTHVGSVGVCLWINKITFGETLVKPVYEPISVTLPTSGRVESEDDSKKRKRTDIEREEVTNQLEQKGDFVTLSGLPKHKWYTITKLDIIRERNKPTEVKEKIIAPFFLTMPESQPKNDEMEIDEPKQQSRLKKASLLDTNYTSSQLLQVMKTKTYEETMEYIKSLEPKMIDVAIRSMTVFDEYSEFKLFLDFICEGLKTHKNYDLLQALLNLFLKVHSETLVKSEECREKLDKLSKIHEETWESLEDLIQHDTCLIKYLSNLQI